MKNDLQYPSNVTADVTIGGFIHRFNIEECGILRCPYIPEKSYVVSKLKNLIVIPLPDIAGNLYHFEASDGEKGTFFVFWDDYGD